MAFPENTVNDIGIKHIWDKVTAALSGKVDKVSGKGLSTNDYTTTEKDKLAGIESGAQVNAVTSVAGKTGAVTLDKADVGLGNVDNTSDASKPISTATQNALDTKADTSEVAGTQTATGNPITLTDASETYAQGLTVELEPQQDLHGYNFPWVGGAGKNKLPLDLATMKSLNSGGTWSGNVYTHNNGVTFTVLTDSDGNVTGIKASGTASVTLSFVVCNVTYSSGSFYLTGLTDYGNGSTRFNLRLTSGGTTISDYLSASGTEFSVTESTTFLCAINIYGGYTCSDLMFYPMVRLSSISDTTFEKWSNICPITGYTECEVDDVGKNQFYYNKIDGKNAQSNKIPYVSGLKIKHFGSTAISGGSLVARFYDEFDNAIGSDTLTYTIDAGGQWNVNAPSGTDYVVFTSYRSSGNGGIDAYIDAEIMCATDVSTYEPYHSSNATIQFGQTVYGGKSNFTEGGTDDEFAEIDLSTLGWTLSTGYYFSNTTLTDAKTPPDGDTAANAYAEKYRIIPSNQAASGGMIGVGIRPKGGLYVSDVGESPSGQLVYEKATPTQLSTPPTNLKLLQDTNNLTTNGTTITLDYIPNNSIGDAVKASEEYTDRAISEKGGVQKTVIFDDLVRIADEITLSLPSSYNFLVFEVNYMYDGATGSAIYSSFNDNINIPANYSGTSHWMELRKAGNIISVRGDTDMDQGGALLKITAF